jgi:hypothetical protein
MIENRLIKTEGGRYAENNGQGVYIEKAENVVLNQEKKSDVAESFEQNKLEINRKLSIQQLLTILTSFEDDLDRKYQVNIKIVDIEKGSINLTLEGSQENLEKLENLFKAGELTEVLGIRVEDVHIVPESDHRQLVFKIAGEIDTEVLTQLKTEIWKSRPVEEVRKQEAKRRDLRETEIKTENLKPRLVEEIRKQEARKDNGKSQDPLQVDLSRTAVMSINTLSADITSIKGIQDEARQLVETGKVSRQQPIYVLCQYISAREWSVIEVVLERFDYLLRDRIGDLIGEENWYSD